MPISSTDLNKAYLAYFGRPSDISGRATFANKELADVVSAFDSSAESKALYGDSIVNKINAIYVNLFNRDAEPAGLQHWLSKVMSGELTPAGVAIAILNGAQNDDAKAVANKLAAADAFTKAIDTTAEILGYSGMAAVNSARAFLKTVDATEASLTAAVKGAEAAVAAAATAGSVQANQGQTLTLTQGLDNIVGTSANDTINAMAFNSVTGMDVTTLNSVDSIDGGAGTDTLNIEVKGATPYNGTLQGTIKNVEIININNTDNTGAVAVVDATLFQGATNINQISLAGNVTKLAATTTAGFQEFDTATAFNVAPADDAAKASVDLKNVAEGSTVTVTAAPTGILNSVALSGTVVDLAPKDGVTNINLAVTAGKDVESFAVNTSTATTLTLNNGAGKTIKSVDASASTGGVNYTTAANVVASIKGGAGSDTLTNIFAGTATANAATLNGGAGNDTLNVTVTKGAATTVTATVDGGDGNDTINLTTNADVKYVVTGGAGNDTVAISTGSSSIKTTDSIDGGEGTDTVSVAGTAARIVDDFIILNKVLKNFEALKFSSAEGAGTALDASKLEANYVTLDFATDSSVDNVGAQALISRGALNAEATGYVRVGEGTPAATAIGYAGTLNITDKGLAAAADAINARAETVNLTVEGGKANAVTANSAVLTGEAKAVTVTLSAGTDTKNTAVTTDDTFVASSVNVAQGAGADVLKDLASLTLTGNGVATVNVGAGAFKLVSLDASGLNSVDEKGVAAAGLTYNSSNTAAETVKLGGGVDSVTLGSSIYGKMDTVEGLNLVVSGGALTAASDTIIIVGNAGLTAAGKMITTQTDLDLALLDAAKFKVTGVDVDTVAFQLGGNTYFYQDSNGDELVDVADTVVKLTGLIDLDALVIAL